MGRKAKLKREDRAREAQDRQAMYAEIGTPFRGLSLKERALLTAGKICETFSLEDVKELEEVKKLVTLDRIREFYRFIATLWPPGVDYFATLPKPDARLRALYLGDPRPQKILQDILRYSLYTDQILVVNPFHNPWRLRKEFDPVYNPQIHVQDTLKLIFFFLGLVPWVEADLVVFIPNPAHHDHDLCVTTARSAVQRLKKRPEPTKEEIQEYTEDIGREMFVRSLLQIPPDRLRDWIEQVRPGMTAPEYDSVQEYVESHRKDPLAPEYRPLEQQGGELVTIRGGANLEQALLICHATGSYPYTSCRTRWREILDISTPLDPGSRVWSPLTAAFQKLDFKYLNNVDLKFACDIRQEGRLERFRNFLRRMWNDVGGGNFEPARLDHLARVYRDELSEAYQQAQADWDGLTSDAAKWLTSEASIGALGGASAAIVTGGMIPLLTAAGFTIAAVHQLLSLRSKRKHFRKTVPMSVFLDLASGYR